MFNRSMIPVLFAVVLIAAAAAGSNAIASRHVPCSALTALQLEDTTIKSAEEVPGPNFTPPGATQPIRNLSAFCRVVAVTTPAVNFEVWLPLQNWNGKFHGVGNVGLPGVISYSAMPPRSAADMRGQAPTRAM